MNARSQLLSACIVVLVAASTGAAAGRSVVPDPQFPQGLQALFDRPLAVSRTIVPALYPGDPRGIVRCFRYPALLVKEVDYGEHGDDHISVSLIRKGAPAPACGLRSVTGERSLPESAETYFVGAKGRFGFVQSTGGQDGTSFTIRDLPSGAILHADDMAGDGVPARVMLAGGTLTVSFMRSVSGDCSILKGGTACWAKFAADAHLASATAAGPAPVALCRVGYAARGSSAEEHSVLSYKVLLTIGASGRPVVRGGAIAACQPRS